LRPSQAVFDKFALPGYDAESLDEGIPKFRQNGSGVLLTLEDDATHFFQKLVFMTLKR